MRTARVLTLISTGTAHVTSSSAETELVTPVNLSGCLFQASPEQQEAGESYAPE